MVTTGSALPGDTTLLLSPVHNFSHPSQLSLLLQLRTAVFDPVSQLTVQLLDQRGVRLATVTIIRDVPPKWTTYQFCLPAGVYAIGFSATVGVPDVQFGVDAVSIVGRCRTPDVTLVLPQGRGFDSNIRPHGSIILIKLFKFA